MSKPDTARAYDVIVIGAGAAGMMCGAVAGESGRKILILDHARKAGEKIRISGGGRCNFTNIYSGPQNFISQNPHFCKSALAGFTPRDFIDLVEARGIAWHEKTLGQLFCDGRSTQIVQMLVDACTVSGNEMHLNTKVLEVIKENDGFSVLTSEGTYTANNMVVACGGPSIPKMGASGFGYQIASQFGMKVITPEPALVPLTFAGDLKERMQTLAGISVPARVHCGKAVFDEAILFTHRGLSGPAILQISSYWAAGKNIHINMAPDVDVLAAMKDARKHNPRQSPSGFLSTLLPQRLAQSMARDVVHARLADMSDSHLAALADKIQAWTLCPNGSEGYRTAEVTRGGVDTSGLSSKTMESKTVPGLYFIGEVVDVTGHLGGHNFQWAWASGVAAGRALAGAVQKK
ncbi:MAG: NAD(P)/FAD-dependent oxidoreductase [Robiginitomaculum sp.]|nr:NAD(P)/FAD-dependent oxidoreductase [Robiginitomaculum sp.]